LLFYIIATFPSNGKRYHYILTDCKTIWGGIMAEKNTLDWVALVLVIVGGLNWGLVGLFQFDLVKALLGTIPLLQNAVYILVGLSAAYMVYYAMKK
jgi:uncharacterized protein